MDKIQEYKLGSFIVDNRHFIGSIKIIDSKIKYWEREGAQILEIQDIDDLLKSQPEYIVIGTGAGGLLKVPDGLRQTLLAKGVSVVVGKTQEVVHRFNELNSQKKKVAGIFNSGS